MRERNTESKCCGRAETRGWWQTKYASPGRRSAPDRIFAKFGRVFFVEFKAPGKDATDLQKEYHKKMRAAGLTVYVCDSVEKFMLILATEEARAETYRWLSLSDM
jgi:hypothetical protein